MMVLEKEKLFGNLKKCTFFTPKVACLGYIIMAQGIKVDGRKIEAIWSWPISKSIHDVQSFHGLASFYRRFIQNFSTIMSAMNEVLKGTSFKWNPKAQYTFKEIEDKLTKASVLTLPCFTKVFEVECDASSLGIGGVLIQEGWPLTFFSEKLYDSRRKDSTYDKGILCYHSLFGALELLSDC